LSYDKLFVSLLKLSGLELCWNCVGTICLYSNCECFFDLQVGVKK